MILIHAPQCQHYHFIHFFNVLLHVFYRKVNYIRQPFLPSFLLHQFKQTNIRIRLAVIQYHPPRDYFQHNNPKPVNVGFYGDSRVLLLRSQVPQGASHPGHHLALISVNPLWQPKVRYFRIEAIVQENVLGLHISKWAILCLQSPWIYAKPLAMSRTIFFLVFQSRQSHRSYCFRGRSICPSTLCSYIHKLKPCGAYQYRNRLASPS